MSQGSIFNKANNMTVCFNVIYTTKWRHVMQIQKHAKSPHNINKLRNTLQVTQMTMDAEVYMWLQKFMVH